MRKHGNLLQGPFLRGRIRWLCLDQTMSQIERFSRFIIANSWTNTPNLLRTIFEQMGANTMQLKSDAASDCTPPLTDPAMIVRDRHGVNETWGTWRDLDY